jgi:hypothetical protein
MNPRRPRISPSHRPPWCWLTLGLALLALPPAWSYFDPAAQRWINRDPIGEPGGLNLAEYCDNRPLSGGDAFGLWMIGGRYDPDSAGYSTIVCDGAGGIEVVLPPEMNGNCCLRDCFIAHEEIHKADALAANPGVCRLPSGKPWSHGWSIAFSSQEEKLAGEIRASEAELKCLEAAVANPMPGCRERLQDRIRNVQKELDLYRRGIIPGQLPPARRRRHPSKLASKKSPLSLRRRARRYLPGAASVLAQAGVAGLLALGCALAGCAHRPAATGVIQARVAANEPGRRIAEFELRNEGAEELKVSRGLLPWNSVTGAAWVAIDLATETCLPRRYSIMDFGAESVRIAPGASFRDRVDLQLHFAGLEEALQHRDVLVFWAVEWPPGTTWEAGRQGGCLLLRGDSAATHQQAGQALPEGNTWPMKEAAQEHRLGASAPAMKPNLPPPHRQDAPTAPARRRQAIEPRDNSPQAMP